MFPKMLPRQVDRGDQFTSGQRIASLRLVAGETVVLGELNLALA
jgi:hypothetical protein